MRYLTYLDENGKHRPACLLDGQVVNFPPALQVLGKNTLFQAHSVKTS